MRVFRNPAILFAFLYLFAGAAYGAEKTPDSNIVAIYDNTHGITIKELHQYVQDWLYYRKFPTRSEAYNNALNDMLVNQFKRMDFFEKGLDKDEKLIQNISRIINEELVAEYYETQYANKYANEDYAKKVYETMDREVVYQSIELGIPENASPEQLDSLQKKALSILSDIENGKDFTSLVKEYSQNQTASKNNGYMPPVDWKQNILDPVGNIVFKLNKGDLRVLNSGTAFLIVQITDVNKAHIEPYDSVKSEIIGTLKNGFANTSLTEYEQEQKSAVDETTLKWNEAALEQIVEWSNIPNFYRDRYQETITDAISNGDNKIVLQYNNNSTLDYKEYLRLLNDVLIIGAGKVKEDDIKGFILEAIRTDYIIKRANSLGLKKNIFNAFTENLTLRNQIVSLYNKAIIEPKIPEASEADLHSFFEKNENTLYHQLEKRNIFVMVFPAREDADKALEKINSGIPFEKVTGSYLVKTYVKEKSGEIRSFLKDEKPVFSETAFKMRESEISGPVKFEDENTTRYAIIKCYQIHPEKQLTFNDVKDVIVEDYKKYHREIIEKSVAEELKNKYHPVIYEEVLAEVISPK